MDEEKPKTPLEVAQAEIAALRSRVSHLETAAPAPPTPEPKKFKPRELRADSPDRFSRPWDGR